MSDCRFGVSPVNYPDPDPEFVLQYGTKPLGPNLAGISLHPFKSSFRTTRFEALRLVSRFPGDAPSTQVTRHENGNLQRQATF